MPVILSSFRAKGPFQNGHFSTIYSAKLRPIPELLQNRERVFLEDQDFIDMDWSFSEIPTKKMTILLHGLEGNAQRTYIKGQGKHLIEHGWDVAAVNYRGCSGEPNMKYSSYNAGKTDDLEAVIQFILNKGRYKEIALVGFSLGGNLLLKYLGEGRNVPKEVTKGVAISSPLSLRGSLGELEGWHNWVYRKSFLKDLKGKLKSKMQAYPEKISPADIKQIKSLFDFDDIYTAKAHGFKDAFDYYEKNSSLQFLPNITHTVLILNAVNDTFLSRECYPEEFASQSKNIYLETPKHGGHVGFHLSNKTYYSETRTLEFLNTKN